MAQSKKQQNLFIVGAIVVVVIVAFVGIILLSQTSGSSGSAITGDTPAARNTDGSYILGDENAPITFVIFSNYFCGHCQDYKETVDRLIDEFVVTGKARVEHRLVGNSPDSIGYAQLTECATEQTDPLTAWQAMDLLFEYATTRRLSANDAGRELATALQLNYARLLECTVTSDQYEIDGQLARSAGTTGTPAVRVRFVGDAVSDVQLISPQYEGGGVDFATLTRIIEDANN
ncbi:MAG: thioredoxin domain-containing protein [bacterium]|nr:thioredoxin domain-containing protein [bacterium]